MQNRHRRLAAISGAVLILGSLMASAAPAVVAQEDAALCQLPDGFKVGIATREMVNDFNRDIVNGATGHRGRWRHGPVTDAGGDPRKHNENVQNLINSGRQWPLRRARRCPAAVSADPKATEAGILVTTACSARRQMAHSPTSGGTTRWHRRS